MSIIGHRTYFATYPDVLGTVVGAHGPELVNVEWDAPISGTRQEFRANLVILDDTVMIDHEPPEN